MGKTCKKFKTVYESAANEVLLKSKEKVCDQIPEDNESGLTPVKIGLMVLVLREDSDPYLVALETNEIIDFDTKSKLINKTNDLILNLTPENVTQHSRIQ